MDKTTSYILLILVAYIAWILSGKPNLLRRYSKIIKPDFEANKRKGKQGNGQVSESDIPLPAKQKTVLLA